MNQFVSFGFQKSYGKDIYIFIMNLASIHKAIEMYRVMISLPASGASRGAAAADPISSIVFVVSLRLPSALHLSYIYASRDLHVPVQRNKLTDNQFHFTSLQFPHNLLLIAPHNFANI